MQRILVLVVLAMALAGCQTQDLRAKRAQGAMIGTALGAFVGGLTLGSGSARLIFATLGAGVGAVGGYYAADHLDRWHKEQVTSATYEVLANRPDGEAVPWGSAAHGVHGTVVATRTLTGQGGRHCREYEIVVQDADAARREARMACRLETGAWETGLGPDRDA